MSSPILLITCFYIQLYIQVYSMTLCGACGPFLENHYFSLTKHQKAVKNNIPAALYNLFEGLSRLGLPLMIIFIIPIII